ncbi:MAG TPA: hypothetical protein VFC98_03900 [Clostridia bacterium]|nr:hypothetical protein [Clostridia bacterium]
MNENLYGNQILFYEYTNYQIIIESKEDYELMHIPAHPDSESGIIRALFRHYPDSDLCDGYTLLGF